jgi:ABC-2 type transport system permease protein
MPDPTPYPASPPADGALRAVLAAGPRPPRPGPVSNALAFAWRALLKIKHIPEQLYDVVMTPVMFTVLFTYLFGGALAGSPAEYLQFLLPGILAQTVIFTSVYTGVTLNTDLQKGIYDRFRSLPVWRPAPLVGAMLGDVLRYTAAGTIVVLVGLVIGYRPGAGPLGVIGAVVLLNAFAFGIGWVFTTLGLALRTPGSVMTISWIFLLPLTFASNVFVEPATMPEWLQQVVAVNPVTHLVTALRGLLSGTATAAEVALALSTPLALTAVFGPVAMALYRRKR